MKNYHDEVVRILLQHECQRMDYIGEGIYKWSSPRTSAPFNVEPHIPSKKWANEILKKAGIAPMIK